MFLVTVTSYRTNLAGIEAPKYHYEKFRFKTYGKAMTFAHAIEQAEGTKDVQVLKPCDGQVTLYTCTYQWDHLNGSKELNK